MNLGQSPHSPARTIDRLTTGDGFPALLLSHPADPAAWPEILAAARASGFGTALLAAARALAPQDEVGRFIAAARSAGLQPWLEIIVDRLSPDHPLATDIAPSSFRAPIADGAAIVDPRRILLQPGGDLQLQRPEAPALVAFWQHCLIGLCEKGVSGFALIDPAAPGLRLAARLRGVGFRIEVLRRRTTLGAGDIPLIDPPPIGTDAESGDARWRAALAEAVMRGGGWAMLAAKPGAQPAGADLARLGWINRIAAADCSIGASSRDWFGPRSALSLRSRMTGSGAIVMAANHGEATLAWPIEPPPGAAWRCIEPVPGFAPAGTGLAPRETFLGRAAPPEPAATIPRLALDQATDPAARIRIAQVTPSVDQGRYAVKRIVWEPIIVQAALFADGHEKLAAAIVTRAAGEVDWTRYPLLEQANDAWIGEFRLGRLGAHEFMVEAWLDIWGGFMRDFGKKRAADQNLALDMAEGRQLLEAAYERVPHDAIAAAIAALQQPDADPAILLDAGLAGAMATAEERRFLTRSFSQKVLVEREAARFSSWYELFPRSQSGDPRRHGCFADVQKRLPHIAAMGFDTLYFPPIHPIGATNRKGRNNSLKAEADDVGSPYAIGSAAGGHDSVHPDLGMIEDFRALAAAARAHGIEIALDFAVQCSPDHPWLKQHPEWFDWRPDGSLKYAENPPKKYEDIVNLDFYAPAAMPGLWEALRDVMLFWAGTGVRAFRVDNPHTKPAPFWEWLIAEIRAQYPDALFLSEAFTRPNPMYHLAKLGFSQSYSYFTWRHGKAEFEAYLTELTETPVREFFRPHFFVNTPDINPSFLQGAGRPGFLIRAALAATLSGLFGVYAGFELCESAALPGREEYLDSEKYQIRPRPDRAPGDIVDEITQLNQLRRGEPALQSHLGVSFHNAANDRILYFSKAAPGRPERILVAISLDPFNPQEAEVEVPLWLFGRPDSGGIEVEDLLSGRRFRWIGKIQHLRLEPNLPYGIWRLNPETEA